MRYKYGNYRIGRDRIELNRLRLDWEGREGSGGEKKEKEGRKYFEGNQETNGSTSLRHSVNGFSIQHYLHYKLY